MDIVLISTYAVVTEADDYRRHEYSKVLARRFRSSRSKAVKMTMKYLL